MATRDPIVNDIQTGQRAAYRVRLPGFVIDEEIGLGDVVTRVAYAFGVTPCGGCSQRAAAMNKWMGFLGGSSSMLDR
jgi:hypothetical protein